MSGHTLTREPGSEVCGMCVGLMKKVAVYTLTRTADGKTWRLCTDHAAAASHRLGIQNPAFNPEGVRS